MGWIAYNGSGKSTWLKVLAEVFTPKLGKVEIDCKVASLLNINIKIQAKLNSYKNSRNAVKSFKKRKSLIPDIKEFTEISTYLSMPIKEYFTGMAGYKISIYSFSYHSRSWDSFN